MNTNFKMAALIGCLALSACVAGQQKSHLNDEVLRAEYDTLVTAAQAGGFAAQVNLCKQLSLHRGEDEEQQALQAEAFTWCLKASESGLINRAPETITLLAEQYYYGRGTPADPEKAFEAYSTAASYGQSHAQYVVALMLYEGTGTEANEAKAKVWLNRARYLKHSAANELYKEKYPTEEQLIF